MRASDEGGGGCNQVLIKIPRLALFHHLVAFLLLTFEPGDDGAKAEQAVFKMGSNVQVGIGQ